MFGVLPHVIARLPISEFQILFRYYLASRKGTEVPMDLSDGTPKDGVIVE